MALLGQTASPAWFRLAPSANAISIAVLRIATGVAAVGAGYGWVRSDLASLPRELWFPPYGTRWAIDVVPVSPEAFRIASLVFVVTALMVVVGYRARPAAAVALAAGLYAGWIPHLSGKVDHYHHIIWFLALLALAPCDDRLSISGPKPLKRPQAYALPALAGVILLGIIYLSSGLPKLSSGLDWAVTDNLRNIMWNQWWEKQYTPALPIDEWPVVYKAMGLGTMAFELLFLPAALYPATRRWIRWVGLAFHLAIRLVLAINFWSFAILYVVLFDWGGGSADVEGRQPSTAAQLTTLAFVLVVSLGALMIPAGWPLSGYPGFAGVAEPVIVEYELTGSEGSVLVTRSGLGERYGSQKAIPLVAVALLNDNLETLLHHVAELEGRPPDFYTSVVPRRISTDPKTAGMLLDNGQSP